MIAKFSDKKQTRGLPMAIMSLLGAVGYLYGIRSLLSKKELF